MLLYNAGISLYRAAVNLLSPFNEKAKLMLKGRKDSVLRLREFKIDRKAGEKVIWIHAASLGEFEQARPLIEKLKRKYPRTKIVVSFFSPSGYEIRKKYELADAVVYLPFDTKSNVNEFLDHVQPDVAIIIKYEFWLNLLKEIEKRKIRAFLVAAVFHEKQPFFKWYGSEFRSALNAFQHIYVQDNRSAELLSKTSFTKYSVSGDPRFDRVIEVSKETIENEVLKNFSASHEVIVIGSSYAAEEEMMLSIFPKLKQIKPELKLLIAPHEINKANIQRLEQLLSVNKIHYCTYTRSIDTDADVIIFDTMGMLSSAYRYGKIAVVGGGFHKGIHNILEAAVYGLPVLFGPDHHRYTEALGLLECGGAFAFGNAEQLEKTLSDLLQNKNSFEQASRNASAFVHSHGGAAEKIISAISI